MVIYLASAYSRKEEMQEVAALLESSGVKVNSRWLHEGPAPNSGREKFMRENAFIDVQDVKSADMLVRFTDILAGPESPSSLISCARMFEFGLAWSLGKPIVVVGGHQNVFDYLPNIIHLKTKEELFRFLAPYEVN